MAVGLLSREDVDAEALCWARVGQMGKFGAASPLPVPEHNKEARQ